VRERGEGEKSLLDLMFVQRESPQYNEVPFVPEETSRGISISPNVPSEFLR
jgi:hypothetical protein